MTSTSGFDDSDRRAGEFDLTDEHRWRALKARDSRFDGRFIVGVRTTGIYCRPSCPTPVQPLRRNVDFFATTAAAQRAGLRACKRCRPDATPGSPEWNLRGDLVGRAMQSINAGWLDRHSVGELARELGVTERHLRRVMIDELGAPPIAIARAQRAQNARVLIETTPMSFTDIAFAAGFSSLRQFNDTVRAVFATTPTDLRRARNSSVPSNDGSGRPGSLSIRIPFRAPLAAGHLLAWWKHRAVESVMAVDDTTLAAALRLARGGAIARLTPHETWVQADLELDSIADLAQAVAQCRSMLDLDADPTHIDQVLGSLSALAGLVAGRPGLRAPGSADGFFTLVFAILGQQRSVAAARTIAGRIVTRASGSVRASGSARANGSNPADTAGASSAPEHPSRAPGDEEPGAGDAEPLGVRLRPFPSAEQLADLDLTDIGLNGRAIDTIHAVADRFAGRSDELAPTGDRARLADELLSVKGIGPWTVNYLAMRVFADPDVYLAGDLVADRSLAAQGLSVTDLDRVRPWRTYATHHLWAASADPKDMP